MKLIKIKSETYIRYTITEMDKYKIRRTLRTNTIPEALRIVKNNDSFNMTNLDINLSKNEEILLEIEFNKLEDLLELVPEEFL